MPDQWSATDMPALHDRSIVVTGANNGIGLVTARELAGRGARVTLAVRDVAKGAAAQASIRDRHPHAEVEVAELDLASLGSVQRFSDRWIEAGRPLDVLINNAGVMATPRRSTADGFELQFGTNHLGHFALTGRLLPALLAASEPRVVTVSSQAHRMGRMNFDDLMGEQRYRPWAAYGQSKLANLLFTRELQRQAAEHGTALRALAAHPGFAATNLSAVGAQMRGQGRRARLTAAMTTWFAQSADMGALPTLYAAVMDLPGDTYVGPNGFGEQRGHPTVVGRSASAEDDEAARALWRRSQDLTGVEYAWPPSTVG